MSTFGQFLLGTLTGTIEVVVDKELEDALQKEHDSNPTAYAATIQAELLAMAGMQTLLANSKSTVVKAIVSGIQDAFTASAAKNGITL